MSANGVACTIKSRRTSLSEKRLVEIWQDRLWHRPDFLTEEGRPLRIIYPGRPNGASGADLTDAIIATPSGFQKGDIEFHIRSSYWQTHCHQKNPAYNHIILHVVLINDTPASTITQDGGKVLTLSLSPYLGDDQIDEPDSHDLPCRKAWQDSPHLLEYLDKAGEIRFREKATEFDQGLAQNEAQEVFYQGMMGALGYAKNKLPCLALARRAPLRALEDLAREKKTKVECLIHQQARLLGAAGLLPSQRSDCCREPDDRWVDKLESAWAAYPNHNSMSLSDWHLLHSRPINQPARRIAAMSYLLLRYQPEGLHIGILNKLAEALETQEYRRLEESLTVSTSGFWASHFDFGLSSRQNIPALIGPGRAAEIIVNVVLPFAYTVSKRTSQPHLAQTVLDFFRHCPRLETNTLVRHMKNQLRLGDKTIDSARRQQGLIHVYKTLCSEGKCYSCALGG